MCHGSYGSTIGNRRPRMSASAWTSGHFNPSNTARSAARRHSCFDEPGYRGVVPFARDPRVVQRLLLAARPPAGEDHQAPVEMLQQPQQPRGEGFL
jgi:hypothetical protein